MQKFWLRSCAILFLVLPVLPVLPLQAQLTRGFISGVVEDPSGAVVPGAAVKIINTATGISTETLTNRSGFYRLVGVELGIYDVQFSKAGLETVRITKVEVAATQEVTLNRAMAVAVTQTSLDVHEAPPGVELNKSSPTIERVLDQSVIANIPITATSRDVTQFALLAPTANRAPGSTQIAADGQRARNDNFLVDGADNNDNSVTQIENRIIPEVVAELQTVVQAYSAEFGHSSGAQIQVLTRSGSNDTHLEAWDYYSGNWMTPVLLFNKRAGLTATPRFDQNQAGGDAGGHLIKNRTFYFALVETNRFRDAPSPSNSSSATIPTPSGFAALQGVPLGPGETQAGFQAALNGIAFLNQIYPQVQNYTGVRTTLVNNVPIQVGTINLPLATPSDFWYIDGRIDHQISDRDKVTYRYLGDKRNQPDFSSNLQFGNLFAAAQNIFYQNHALSETHAFKANFINEFRAAYARSNLVFLENDPTTPTTGITGLFTIGGLSSFPQARVENNFQFQDVGTYLMGRNSFKFGADIRRYRLYNLAAFNSKGVYTFDNLQNYIDNTATSLIQAINTATFDARQTSQNYFFQDDIKLAKNLTLNLGVRYETAGVPFGFFGATDAKSLSVGVPGPVGRDTNNWAPRFGIAYSPLGTTGLSHMLFGEGQTVFRGGYGMGYDVLFYNILTNLASNYPRVVTNMVDRSQLQNVWPNLIAPPSNVVPAFDPLATWANTPQGAQNPTTHFYSFAMQRQLGHDVVLEIAYAGSRSYHGIRQGQLNPGILTPAQAATVDQTLNPSSIPGLPGATTNPPVPNRRLYPWGSRVTVETTAKSDYNSMYIKVDKRLSHGLMAGGNFTWSANFSDNDEGLGVAPITNWSPAVPQDYFNLRNEWARSAFDVPLRTSFFLTYQVPWFQSHALNSPVMKQIFKGWNLNGFSDFQSGQPFTIRTGVDTYGIGNPAAARPSYNPSGIVALDPATGNWRTFTTPINGTGLFNTPLASSGLPLADSVAFPVSASNLGRNTYRGPGTVFTNASVVKAIRIRERWNAELRCDFINAFNHRNFSDPVATMSSPTFGQNIQTDPGGRSMLASLKIKF